MSRIFLSYENTNRRQAIALKRWLVEQNPPLDNDIFLDVDARTGIGLGLQWKKELTRATQACKVMICLVTPEWERSPECNTEFRTAESMNKKIIIARLDDSVGVDPTREWQWVDLFGLGGPQTEIRFDFQKDAHSKVEPTVVTFPTRSLKRLRDDIVSESSGADTFVWPPPNDQDRTPYRGWDALDEFDAGVFFGRDGQIFKALGELRKMRESEEGTLFVILGPSGAGKSSFLRAGLLPRLRLDDRHYVVFDIVRPEGNVLTGDHGLAASIHATRARFKLTDSSPGDVKRACLDDSAELGQLLDSIHRAAIDEIGESPDGPPVLVLPLDQAEELFGVDAGPEESRFLDLIGQYARTDVASRVPLIIAMTIRTDHYDALHTAPALGQEVKSVAFTDLKPMPPAEFREVIVGPARRATEAGHGLVIDDDLVHQLLIDGTKGAQTLPLLALTLDRLFKDYGDDGRLELREYREMGGMQQVVTKEVDLLLSREPATRGKELTALRAAFIPRLATINPDNDQPIRRVAAWADFTPDAQDLLERFVGRRLLLKDKRKRRGEDGKGEDYVVEVALESLLEHWSDLKGWLEEEREDLKRLEILKREAASWSSNGRQNDWLLTGRRPEDAESLLKRTNYEDGDEPVHDFISESAKKSKRRKRWLQGAVAAIVVVALVTAFMGYRWQETSQRETAGRLLTESTQMLEGSRTGGDARALLQLLAAQKLGAPTAEAVASTRRTMLRILENPAQSAGAGEWAGVSRVYGVAVNPVDGRIAWGSDNNTVSVFDPVHPDGIRRLDTGGPSPSQSVAFSPDGKWLAAASGDHRMLLWSGRDLVEEGAIPQGKAVKSIAFSPDSRLVATATEVGLIRVWGVDDQQPRQTMKTPPGTNEIRSIAFSPKDDHIVSGADDKAVRLWDVATGLQVVPARLDQERGSDTGNDVMAVAFRPDGERIVVVWAGGRVQQFDARTLAPASEAFQAHPDFVQSVAFSHDGERIATGATDGSVRVWDAKTQEPIGTPFVGHHGMVNSVAFGPKDAWIISGSDDGSVRMWDAIAGLPILPEQGNQIRDVQFNNDGTNDGTLMASAGNDGTVKVWETATAKLKHTLRTGSTGSGAQVFTLAFAPDGTHVIAGDAQGKVHMWDMANPRQVDDLEVVDPPGLAPEATSGPRAIRDIAFSPSGKFIAAVSEDTVVRVWNADTLEPIDERIATAEILWKGVPKPTPYRLRTLAFSPHDDTLFTGSGGTIGGGQGGYLQRWQIDGTSTEPLRADGPPTVARDGYDVYGVSLDESGHHVAASLYDGTVRVLDTRVARPDGPLVLTADQSPVMNVAFANHRALVVTASIDGKLRLWDTSTTVQLGGADSYAPIGAPLTGHSERVYSVAFSPDDEWILSGGADSTLHLWRTPPANLQTFVCSRLAYDISEKQWDRWIAQSNPTIRYDPLCPDLDPAPD